MSRIFRVRAACVAALGSVLLAMPSIRAQTPPPVAFASVREVQPQPGPAREWRMTLPAATSAERLARLPAPSSRPLAIARVPDRDPQLTPDSLVVVAVDVSGNALDWQIVHDPRVIRAESPGPDGLLSGRKLTFDTGEIRAALTGGNDTTELRVYQPRWTGTDWQLDPIATARVTR